MKVTYNTDIKFVLPEHVAAFGEGLRQQSVAEGSFEAICLMSASDDIPPPEAMTALAETVLKMQGVSPVEITTTRTVEK